jgi:hypothetical protein
MELVKNDGAFLVYANDSFKDDKDIIITAVKSNINSLIFASERLKNDPEVKIAVLETIKDSIVN